MYLLLQNLEQKSTKHTRAVIMHFCPSIAQQRRSEPAVAAAAAQAQEAQTFETPIVCRLSGEKNIHDEKGQLWKPWKKRAGVLVKQQ